MILAAIAVTTLAVGGCASGTPIAGSPAGSEEPLVPASAPGEVLGQGTVLQVGDAAPQFCLGAVMESYPPQCSGPEIVGWDWTVAGYSESASGVTWGAYAVQGLWDGETFEVTEPPIPLALYSPMFIPDPHLDESNPGPGSESELARIQEDSGTWDIPGMLSSWPTNGYLFVQVIYDDGTIQDALDARYGSGVVVVQSALRDLE